MRKAILVILLLAPLATQAAPAVSNLVAPSGSVARNDMFVADFDVSTVASNLYWPYDAAPPAPIPPGAGVTVDGLFSKDNWATTLTVPGFYYQDYTRHLVPGIAVTWAWCEMFVPSGVPRWRVRFAPATIGSWRYRIRVRDAGGVADSSEGTFECLDGPIRGFLRVSPTDSRYFELSDGSLLLGPGLNGHIRSSLHADQLLKSCGDNGVKVLRYWMMGTEFQAPFGSYGAAWYGQHVSASGGSKPGDYFSAYLTPSQNYAFHYFWAEAGKRYRISGHYRLSGVIPSGAGLKISFGTLDTPVLSVPAEGWTPFSVDYTATATGQIMVWYRYTGTAGTVYYDDLTLEASSDGGATWSADYMSKGDMDFLNYVDQPEAWECDLIFDAAKRNGVYLRTVLTEKQDPQINDYNYDGTVTEPGSGKNSNFYAVAGGAHEHPSRWLQKAWWRYALGRWGAFTSLHSLELCNEADPFDPAAYDAGDAFANYVHANYPRRVLTTISFWREVASEYWKSSACDYLDVHHYLGGNEGSNYPYRYAWCDSKYFSGLLPLDDVTQSVDYDSLEVHSGSRSLRLVSKVSNASCGAGTEEYHVGIDPTHSYTLRYWAKALDAPQTVAFFAPGVDIVWSKWTHDNDFISQSPVVSGAGTYDWKQVTQVLTPPVLANTVNIRFRNGVSPSTMGTFWIDDVEFIDNATGENLFVDGGFEGDRIDYDTALGIRRLAVRIGTYAKRVNRPVMLGETAIDGPDINGTYVKGTDYKGNKWQEEAQQLVDDVDAVYLKKMLWAHLGAYNPNMLYFFTDLIEGKGRWAPFKSFQAFVSRIPLSNGHYEDARATTSNPSLRAWGQKDLANNSACLWIDNSRYTWKKVVDKGSIPLLSGDVSLSGLADGLYTVDWWDTATGTIIRSETVSSGSGSMTLAVRDLQSDVACQVHRVHAKLDLRVTVPSASVVPGQVVTVSVEYTNVGDVAVAGAQVVARVPAEMEYVPGSADSGGNWDAAYGTISWTVDSVPPAGTGVRRFQARVR